MRAARLRAADGRELVPRVAVCETRWEATRGLLARPRPGDDEGLWIPGCALIHTAFMGGAIDAVFVGADGRVTRVAGALGPWRLAWGPGAAEVLELAPGNAARLGIVPGLEVRLEPDGATAPWTGNRRRTDA